MSSWTGIPELKESYRSLGAVRFAAILIATFAWIAAGAGLAISLNFPASAGSSCRRKCMIESYWWSPSLLSGGWQELALFAWLWSIPAFVAGTLIYGFIKKRGIFAKSDSE